MTAQVVETGGRCLAALCVMPASHHVLMPGDWWWPECGEHTDEMRRKLKGYVIAIRPAP